MPDQPGLNVPPAQPSTPASPERPGGAVAPDQPRRPFAAGAPTAAPEPRSPAEEEPAPDLPAPGRLLEERQILSQSLIWDLQQRYYAERGVDAWRQGEVPHYVTSNAVIAKSYAELALAMLRDRIRLAGQLPQEPLTICELGAGPGRFAFHVLSHLRTLLQLEGLPETTFRYLLTDSAQSNLDFWRSHASLQPFFERGMLDLALFDINDSMDLRLQMSGETIGPGSLQQPLLVFANYILDSIPQDLYYVEGKRCRHCKISITIDEHPRQLTVAEVLARMRYRYDVDHEEAPPYDEDWLQELMETYRQSLSRSHVLVPVAGLRCLRRLQALSPAGLLLISADKGSHHLAGLQGMPPPALVRHGSLSLHVNYHAYRAVCERDGGLALFPSYQHSSIIIGCLLLLPHATGYEEIRRAYRRYVEEWNPDDFHTVFSHVGRAQVELSLEEILAFMRISAYDSYQCARYLPPLLALAPSLRGPRQWAVAVALKQIWAGYFPLGEQVDMAYQIGCIFYAMGDYVEALSFFAESIALYGQFTGTLYNMAMCYHMLNGRAEAEQLLCAILADDPSHDQARDFLNQL